MPQLHIVGSQDFCLGFRLAGLKSLYPSEETPAQKTFGQLLEGRSGVIVTDITTFSSVDKKLQLQLEQSANPVVVVLSADDHAADSLRERVKSAIGVDVWNK
ncbi:hypothetical protein J4439_08030 [Candidatus Woesearchaeota archaeon]|nr:hypothetical protein [Candidatus Woesearchaeota archaeon]